MASLLHAVAAAVNKSLAPLGVKITKTGHAWDDVASFIPFEQTLASARRANMSIGDYVDGVMNGVPGASQATVDKMTELGVFARPLHTIVEIGPGTGRYLEKTVKAARPVRYEIYETAGPWAAYLVGQHDVILQPTDGHSLAATASTSADLVHAHKVFSTVPFIVTCAYWREMVRVIRPGGWAVFDIMTERCLSGDAMEVWASSHVDNGSFPAAMPREVATRFFAAAGFALVGSVVVPMPPGVTELMVFKRG